MDGHDGGHELLAAFLARDLDPADALRWDEHLLECERCWRAVREDQAGRQAAGLLRKPAPPGLADRVAFTVEVAATEGTAAQQPARAARSSLRVRSRAWLSWPRLAGAGAVAVGVAVTLVALLLPGGHASMPASVAAVARYAQGVPLPVRGHPSDGGRAAPVEVGRPVTITAGGQRVVLRTWRLGGTEAVVAVSGRPFPMPARSHAISGGGMAWSARLGRIGLYCLNGRTSELVAAPLPPPELAALAARLPLA